MVEDTLNALLEEEADDLVKADRYERTAEREAYQEAVYFVKKIASPGLKVNLYIGTMIENKE